MLSRVPDGAETLDRIGQVLGAAGIGLEGGGMWSSVARHVVADGPSARQALVAAGFKAVGVRPALVVPLRADAPGELGRMIRRLADAQVILHAHYSDHDNRKVLVVDDLDVARAALA